jgi:hypothetical protein
MCESKLFGMIGKEWFETLEETPPRCSASKGIKKVLTIHTFKKHNLKGRLISK